MKHPRRILAIAAVTAGAAALCFLQHQAASKSRQGASAFAQLASRSSELKAENQRLSDSLTQLEISGSDSHTNELQRLRQEAQALRGQLDRIERNQLAGHHPTTAQPNPEPGSTAPENEAHFAEQTASKARDAHPFNLAIAKYPFLNDGAFPSSFEHLAGILSNSPKEFKWAATNEFEIIYTGSRNDWTNIPWGSVAVLRERQPRKSPSGKWVRVYGMGDSHTQVVESEDNFRSWEALHVIPPPTPQQ
jgi:hypothetical protein